MRIPIFSVFIFLTKENGFRLKLYFAYYYFTKIRQNDPLMGVSFWLIYVKTCGLFDVRPNFIFGKHHTSVIFMGGTPSLWYKQ